ncbi:MAG: alpha-glucosidase [Pyrinomonadaceae bacterium MAG19_C2-C3]|nr:alpha-glucosidase [Pyrinomonadaceae bacterium MAG19_C2-C3]
MTHTNEHNSEQSKADARDAVTANGYTKKWWKEAVVYQIYPRSFKDSNADGIGDLRGIASQLDYIQNLGVDVVWLSPMYDSPNADNGYDIRDYRKVMSEFGTMADFDELLEAVKARGMKMILDLVVNHTSDDHFWFVESRKAKDNPYRDYYLWREGKDGKEPNDWVSYFSGSAWKKDDATGEYYLHLFAEKQPDLNWDNQTVREEVYDVMRFWLDKGIDGFRMDVIPFISKDPNFPDFPDDYDGDYGRVYASGAKLHDYVQEMNREVLSKYDVMTVGEAEGVTLAEIPLLVDERRDELNMVFQFDVVKLDRESWRWKSWTLPGLKAIYTRFERGLDKHCWNALFLSNHDNPRVVSRFGDDSPPYRMASAKLLAMMLLTLKGTPFIYQGDELGMTNYPFTNIAEFDDIQVKNAWQAEVLTDQVEADDYIINLRRTSRDHARTPMQWDASDNAGFTLAAKAWLAVNPNYKEINAVQALNDQDSIYNFFKQLIQLRKETPALIYGDYVDLDPQHPTIFVFTRTLEADKYLVLLNFSNDDTTYKLPVNMRIEQLLISNLREQDKPSLFINLKGWEASLYKFNS